MEESPESKLTLRQAVSRQWQIPLFVFSLLAFGLVLLQMRPRSEPFSFDKQYEDLQHLAQENRYQDFYESAEQLRLSAENESQLGKVHGLAAQTRVKELRGRHELGLEPYQGRGVQANYESIIKDYREALRSDRPDPNSPEAVCVFRDLGLAYWGLNDAEKAINMQKRAIALSETFDSSLHRSLVRMYLIARPKGYLDKCLSLLDKILSSVESGSDDKAWAFVRKAGVLIAQGKEDQTLAMLDAADETFRNSIYGDELELLRGRALRHAGKGDQADLILRELIRTMTDRGDIYAQVALELGKINYEQYRDHDAREFYKQVVETQLGKDWYVAGNWGLAQCAAMQHRYDEATSLYQEVVDLLKDNPLNGAVEIQDVQNSLITLSEQLTLLKQYDLALPFLEIEQQIAEEDDLQAANRFARIHYRLAMQLSEQIDQGANTLSETATEAAQTEQLWFQQREKLKNSHFEQAAKQFLRVAELTTMSNDELYGDSLWLSAICYDRAGNALSAIDAWQRFTGRRESKSRWPQAMFHLAQAYQAIGDFDSAIANYKILRLEKPHSPAAFESVVPMARCYLSKEPSERDEAKTLLLSVLKDPAQTPGSNTFRRVVFELGQLYYNDQKYVEAINTLNTAIARYPDDPGLGKYMFLVGDSYRKSGLALDAKPAELSDDPTTVANYDNTSSHKSEYLESALDYFRQAIDFYENIPQERRDRHKKILDDLYLRHSRMCYADCLYDLARYNDAVVSYEGIVLQYQLTPTALMAFTQIINCYVKLGESAEAASTNSRAIWQLTKMPDSALADSTLQRTREQWEQWFDWTEKSGLW